MKQCIRCNQIKNKKNFFKNKDTSDGLQSWCKDCFKEYYKEYYLKNSEKIKETAKNFQRENVEKIGKQKKKYRQEHKKYFRGHGKIHYQKHLKNNKEHKDQQKKYRENNKEELKKKREKNKKKLKKYNLKYRREHRSELRKYARGRILKKLQLFEIFTEEEWQMKVDATNSICPICGRDYSDVWPYCPTMDHTPPISKAPIGFVYTIDDIQPMCHACNSSKNVN